MDDMALPTASLVCPSCGGQLRRKRHDWLLECADCGLLSSTLAVDIPSDAGKSVIDEAARSAGLNPIRRKNNSIILGRIAELRGRPGGKLLDVGCGQGQFLEDSAAAGFDVLGIEPDANVVHLTRQRTGATIRRGFFPDVLQADEQFDVIAFNDVFEHIPDASSAIAACAHHLAPGGVLVLNCPNQEGLFYRIADLLDRLGFHGPFDRMWQRGLPSPHVWYFSPAHLIRLARHVGLQPAATDHLLPIAREGLRERIFHIKGQSPLVGMVAFAAASILLPFLRILPHDIAVAFLTRPPEQ